MGMVAILFIVQNHLNKLLVPLRQKAPCEIWWKLASVFREENIWFKHIYFQNVYIYNTYKNTTIGLEQKHKSLFSSFPRMWTLSDIWVYEQIQNFQWSSSSNNNLLVNNNCELWHEEMSKHNLRIRGEKRNKLHKMKQGKKREGERNEELWSRFLQRLWTVCGAGEVRLISLMCAPTHCHYLKVHLV